MKARSPELPETTYTLDDFMGENEVRPQYKKKSFTPRPSRPRRN